MRRSSSEHPSISAVERWTVIALGLYLSAVGIHALAAGRLLYPNYLRTPVLAPIAVAIGIVLMVAGVTMRN